MKPLFWKSTFVLVVVFLAAGESHACNAAPTAIICGPATKYMEPGARMIDASCSSDTDGQIVKYEWDYDYGGSFDCDYDETPTHYPDGAFDGKHYCWYTAGTHTTAVRVTDNGGLTGIDGCTVHAVTLNVDVPASYPQWVHVGDSLELGCTVTPSGLGGSYVWSEVIGPGTMTFSPSDSNEDPCFSADERGVYRAKVQYTISDLTLTDATHNMYVVEVELFRDTYYQQRLNDWPAEGSLSRSAKYLFGVTHPIYVKVAQYAPDSDTREFYEDAVKVTSDAHSDVVYLDLKEGPADNYVICTNEWADNELLYLDESTSDDPGADDKIEVEDEDVLTFYLEVPPQSGTYVESNSVMIDRAEVGVEWQVQYMTYDSEIDAPLSDDRAEGFYNNLGTSNRVWFKNFNNGDVSSEKSHWESSTDSAYADSVDFAWWSGHAGGAGLMAFFVDLDPLTGTPQPLEYLMLNDIDWGDEDMEWVVVTGCKFLHSTDALLEVMADGVHLICSFDTDSFDADDGECFANLCDSSYTIKNAWFATCDAYQPDGTTARVFGADYCVNDFIMSPATGPVFVTRDPTSSSSYTHWDHTVE